MGTTTEAEPIPDRFSDAERDRFLADGYAVVRGLAPAELLTELTDVTQRHLREGVGPIEYEADVGYPGAPPGRDAKGGRTARRLLQAHARDPAFTRWLQYPGVVHRLQQLLGPQILCPLAHHNCVMTKHPDHGSMTPWHQDIRYWSFARPELISVWLALGREYPDNGGLLVIPGTHREQFGPERFDEALSLREDVAENAELLGRAVAVRLEPGDVLFFHCRLLHSAGRNNSDSAKYSLVFTYRSGENPPREGSRSASMPETLLHG